MTEEFVDELGLVDYLVVEFPAERADFSGDIRALEESSPCVELVDRAHGPAAIG